MSEQRAGAVRAEPTTPCGDCGQRVRARDFHTYLHCVLYKAGVDPADYGLVIVRTEHRGDCKKWGPYVGTARIWRPDYPCSCGLDARVTASKDGPR